MFFCRSRSGPQRGFAARKKRGERPHVRVVVRSSAARNPRAPRSAASIGEQHEHRTLGREIFAQARLELLEPRARLSTRA